MRIEIRNVEAKTINSSLKSLVEAGFGERDLKLIVFPEDIDTLAGELGCDPLEIEEGTRNLRIKGCDVEIEMKS